MTIMKHFQDMDSFHLLCVDYYQNEIYKIYFHITNLLLPFFSNKALTWEAYTGVNSNNIIFRTRIITLPF